MDDNVAGAAAAGAPLTRRQIRLAAQEAERRRAEADAQHAEPGTPDAQGRVDDGPVIDDGPVGSDGLPAAFPEEPEVDDVRWDGPLPAAPPQGTPSALRSQVQPPLPADMELTRPVPRFPSVWPDQEEELAPAAAADGVEHGGALRTIDEVGDHPTNEVPRLGYDLTGQVPRVDGAARVPLTDVPAGPVPPTLPPTTSAWAREGELPTLDDLLARRARPQEGPAEHGWRATVRRLTGGLVRPGPSAAEQRRREDVAAVRREFDGPRTIVVVNPKGGAHKTTAALLIAATFGNFRGGYTLAWDNNETRGTLGWRAQHARHTRTAVDLLESLDRFEELTHSRVGDLDAFVRAQPARFDVLASDEDAASAASIDGDAFRALHGTLSRFYRVMVIDTGNNMRASNWQAALEAADQVVFVSTVREDTAQSAAWAADALRATGHEDAVRNAVTVLADPAVERDRGLAERLHDHFGRLTRAVVDVPYDPALVAGSPLDVEALAPRTREAWLRVTATVARGL